MFSYKVPEGKLVRLKMDVLDGVIKNISITGDFFLHPEEGIMVIEEGLKGVKVSDAEERLRDITMKYKLRMVGFDEKSLADAITAYH